MDDWWFRAFPIVPYEKSPPKEPNMLIVVAYDISDNRRLAKVAKVCEDYGTRVQYSVFECYLNEWQFINLWTQILELIDETQDRVVAYKIDAKSAKQTVTAGTMVCSEKSVCYLV
ncbi:MAG: CRISPR-associated endonuclease Cas2 [Verrucomicrobiia bacterium]